MVPLKVVAFSLIALGSLALFLYARGKSWERSFALRSLVAITIAKFLLCVAVYLFLPSLVQYSDARNFYLPHTEQLLAGGLPYRDFDTPYSPLFYALLVPLVSVWRSPGAVVLTMLLLETAMLWIYLRRDNWSLPALRCSFLYAFSPVSVYWVALSGHNGIVIAFCVMVALVLAGRNHHYWSGVAASCGLIFCKLLGVLSWPGIVLFERSHRWRRLLPMLVTSVALFALFWFRSDSFRSMRQEFQAETTGNLWFFVSLLLPESMAGVVPYLPIMAFGVVLVPLWVAFARNHEGGNRFDAAAAFVAGTYLLFMLVSRKAFSFYIVMGLLLVIHTILRAKHPARHLIPLSYVMAVSWLEETHSTSDLMVVCLEFLRIASYGYLAWFCFRMSLSNRENDSGSRHRIVGRDPEST